MRIIFGLVLVLGMGLAGFAVYMAKGYIGNYQDELARERAARSQMIETVNIYVSARPLKYGERIGEDDIKLVRWPTESLPAGVYHNTESLFPKGVSVMRTVIRAMEENEAILAVKVTGPGEDAGVSSRLSRGMRAFALRVDVASGVSGFLRPGDRVDVYWTGQNYSAEDDGRGSELTQLIQASVKLLAVDQIADQNRSTTLIARTVTVEATPQQVAKLAQAQATGKLSLSLVGAEDTDLVGDVAVDGRDLLGIEQSQVVAIERERTCSVTTRRGGEIIQTPIPCTN